jgi:hypothetical protein
LLPVRFPRPLAEVVVGLERVRAFCGGKLVADHERIWARHQTLTDPAHWAAAQALRRQRLTNRQASGVI